MLNNSINSNACIEIWSTQEIDYGVQVTLISPPSKKGKMWTTNILESPDIQVHFNQEVRGNERLIIIKKNGAIDNLFGYIGIPADALDQATDELTKAIEEDLLRTPYSIESHKHINCH